MKKRIVALITVVFCLLLCACGGKKPQSDVPNITLLLSGWTNTPTDSNDPYRAWIREKYGLNVTLNASTDFVNAASIGFAGSVKPNIVSFPDFNSFQAIRTQGVLLEDWTPWLEYMPNFARLINSDGQRFTKQVLTDSSNRLNAIWTPSNPPTWSLKIREDWANEYRATTNGYDENGNIAAANAYIPAGATVTDGGEWMPNTPEDLLYFARYIKVFKNSNKNSLDIFGFTTAGGGNSLGTLETWMPLMWGRVPVAPYGYYVDSNNQVQFSTTDGTFEPYLNYLRQLNDEKLIDPNWYSQSFADDHRTTAGKIGIQWYPGSITTSTQIDANAGLSEEDVVDTTDWWETYPLPVATSNTTEYAGYMAGQGFAGNIITVSKQTSMNASLMQKICALIDDCYAYYDEQTDTYERGAAYDALRWGVGIESSVSYQPIADSNLAYCNGDGDGNTYRSKFSGAWDWGAWISSSYDGIVQGNTPEISALTLKVAEHNLKTATYKTTPQIGEFLVLNNATVTDMVLDMAAFSYRYATRQTSQTVEEYCTRWRNQMGGAAMLEEVRRQFISLDLLQE